MTDLTQTTYLTLNGYQEQALATCLPSAYHFDYLVCNLASEAGEVAGKYAKYVRDGGEFPQGAMILELGDVLWQAAVLADKLGMTLADVAELNLAKLALRKQKNTLSGSGDAR
jgi:NTP pyrophosphatase (non-canonical NTP hydrolase)